MFQLRRRSKQDTYLQAWSQLIREQTSSAVNLTVGLMGGSRLNIDRRAVDRLAIAATDELRLPALLIRLNVSSSTIYAPKVDAVTNSHDRPIPQRSPLGRWTEVSLELPLGGSAPKALESLPKWLAAWKKEYRLVMVDLGPMHLVPSRTVGRYCDACYLVLGPYSCASHTWIMQQIALLSSCDVSLSGTIIADVQAAVAA